MIQKTKEFRELSDMAVTDIFNSCELVELTDSMAFDIQDYHKMDFLYLIKGNCTVEFEVKRIFDRNADNETVSELTNEEIESKNDLEAV